MTRNQLQYQANMIQDAYNKAQVKTRLSELLEAHRHNLASEELSQGELGVHQRQARVQEINTDATAVQAQAAYIQAQQAEKANEIRLSELQEKNRSNLASESINRSNAQANLTNASANVQNAASNAKNADTNAINAATNQANAVTNAANMRINSEQAAINDFNSKVNNARLYIDSSVADSQITLNEANARLRSNEAEWYVFNTLVDAGVKVGQAYNFIQQGKKAGVSVFKDLISMVPMVKGIIK